MPHSPIDRERDARINEAARGEMVAADRRRSPSENIERSAQLKHDAEEFRRAFARVLPRPER